MRRLSMALALVGAVAVTGCSGSSSPASSGNSKGTPGSTFTVEVRGDTTAIPANGTIVSSPAGIRCGGGQTACTADFPWGTPVTLTATGAAGFGYYAFAGSCMGSGTPTAPYTCDLRAPNADQMVVVRFSGSFVSHPNFSDGKVHAGPAYSVNCSQCHGSANEGQGLAPACNTCHNGSYVERTGLVATIDAVNLTAPVTVQFTLRDEQGKLVDVTGLSTTSTAWSRRSQPMPITLSLNYFGVDAAGNVGGYRSAANGNPATIAVRSNTSWATSGTKGAGYVQLAADGTVATTCAAAAPCACSVASPCYGVVTAGTQAGAACTAAAPCYCSAKKPCGPALATANGPGALTLDRTTGQYTYTLTAAQSALPADGTGLANATVWMQTTRQEDRTNAFNARRFTAVNVDFNLAVPGVSGTVIGARRITTPENCAKCHNGFKAEALADGSAWAGFHGAARTSGPYCAICHYDNRGSAQWVGVDPTTNPTTGGAADSAVFVHRLHAAEEMLLKVTTGTSAAGVQFKADGTRAVCSAAASCACTAAEPCIPNAFHGMTVTYPQTPANCRECHPDTAQGNQFKTNPSRAACGSCHDAIDFVTGAGHNSTGLHGIPQNLPATDAQCAGCHLPPYIESAHKIALPPDAGSAFHVAGGNTRTNAGWIAPAGKLPAGAIQLSAVVREVRRAVINGTGRPQIDFKLQGQTATVPAWDVVFNASVTDGSVQPELVTSFVGSVGVYFAWALPQDSIPAPADFNTTAGASLKLLWSGKGAGTGAGTLTGPDASGFYTATLTGVQIPTSAVMLTGGIGYQYDLPNNQPFTQTDLAAFPVSAATNPAYAATGKIGGLIVPIQNQWKTATGYAARRVVVENARCNACHAQLGVGPTFHVGQRNDAPTCAFCHNPNRSNSATGGWSVNSAAAIHGIHGAKARVNDFTWEGAGYYNVEYPGSSCEQCHVPGSYNFANAASQAQLPNMLFSSVAGTQAQTTHWVTAGQVLGAGPACSSATGACTPGNAANLVMSPIAGACFACHDSDASKGHMEAMGGKIYAVRGNTTPANAEACLSCHGAGKVLDVAKVH